MASLSWSPRYSCAIGPIDDDHRGLFDLVETLDRQHREGRGAGELAATINALVLYAHEHFEREERLMASARVPDIAAHLAEHRRFTRLVRGLQALHAEAPERVDVGKVVDFLADWLSGHILGADARYVPFLKGEAEADPEAEHADAAETVTLRLPAGRAASVRAFADVLDAGGEIAEALEGAVAEAARVGDRRLRADAETLFCC